MLVKMLMITIWTINIIDVGFCTPKRPRNNEPGTFTSGLFKHHPRNDPFINVSKYQIKQYEKEHSEMIQNAINNEHKKWAYINEINAHEFCANYYKSIYPMRTASPIRIAATIFPELMTLIYTLSGFGMNEVVVLMCCFQYTNTSGKRVKYHITKSSKPYHVYALDTISRNNPCTFQIVGKVEVKKYQEQNENQVQKLYQGHKNSHPFTHVPIEVIEHYENKHFKMLQDIHRDSAKWINGRDLEDFCNKYFNRIFPRRAKPLKITGKIIPEAKKLIYVISQLDSTEVVVVQCNFYRTHLRRNYYVTESPEPNHVYGLSLLKKLNKEHFYIVGEVLIDENSEQITAVKSSDKNSEQIMDLKPTDELSEQILAANALMHLQLKF